MSENEMTNPNSAHEPGSESTAAKADYEIGFGRPPKHTQFQPGQSGHPQGRPPGSRNLRTIIMRVMNTVISVRAGDKRSEMPMFEAMVHEQTVLGVKGDPRAANLVFNLVSKAGLLDRDEESGHQESRTAADLFLADTDPTRLSGDESDEMVKLCRFMDENAPGSLRPERQARLMELIFKATPPCNAGAADGGDAAATEDDADDSESVEMFSMPPPGAAPSEGARV
jgi:hypothetical protein